MVTNESTVQSSPCRIKLPLIPQSRRFDGVLLTVYCFFIFAAIWASFKLPARIGLVGVVAFAAIYLLPDVRNILGLDRNRRAWMNDWTFPAVATMVMALGLIIFVFAFGIWSPQTHVSFVDKTWTEMILQKLPTVIFQQCLLQWHFMPLLLRVVRRRTLAYFLGAGFFSLFHLPNPFLMALTFIAGWVWVYSYHANRRLTPLIISHLCLAMVAANCCGEFIFNMRVGWGCVALLPKPIRAHGFSGYELPGCAVGEVDRVTVDRDEGRATIHGWFVDSYREAEPNKVFAESNGVFIPLQFSALVTSEPEPIEELEPQVRSRFQFDVKVPCDLVAEGAPWRLWMTNKNGWFYQFHEYRGALEIEADPSHSTQLSATSPTMSDEELRLAR